MILIVLIFPLFLRISQDFSWRHPRRCQNPSCYPSKAGCSSSKNSGLAICLQEMRTAARAWDLGRLGRKSSLLFQRGSTPFSGCNILTHNSWVMLRLYQAAVPRWHRSSQPPLRALASTRQCSWGCRSLARPYGKLSPFSITFPPSFWDIGTTDQLFIAISNPPPKKKKIFATRLLGFYSVSPF